MTFVHVILDITLHMPNEDDLETMDGILSPDEGEAKMFIPKQVLIDEMNGQYYYVMITARESQMCKTRKFYAIFPESNRNLWQSY